MSDKKIQQQFGQRVVSSLATYAGNNVEAFGNDIIQEFVLFARQDIESPTELEQSMFNHVEEPQLRQALAQVLYGARWLYKLGLALLVEGGSAERAAHVRAQIVDYASIVEALLSYCNGRAIDSGYAKGEAYKYKDPLKRLGEIRWEPGRASRHPVLRKQPLWWQSLVAKEFGIITSTLYDAIDVLRGERNTVHVRERVAVGKIAYLNESKEAFNTLILVSQQTRLWCASNPRRYAAHRAGLRTKTAAFHP